MKRKSFIKKLYSKKLYSSEIFKKVISYLIIAILSYIINHIQTSSTINKLNIDNDDLAWAVDYFRH